MQLIFRKQPEADSDEQQLTEKSKHILITAMQQDNTRRSEHNSNTTFKLVSALS